MKWSLRELPEFRSEPVMLAAGRFQRVRLALARNRAPLYEILGRRGLEFHLYRDRWLCCDRRLDGRPVLAWTEFEHSGRHGLNLPVSCRQVLFSSYGALLAHSALEELDWRIANRLAEARPERGAQVVAFPRTPPAISPHVDPPGTGGPAGADIL